MAGCLREANANLGGAFPTSAAADEVMERGRADAADFTGGEPDGIAFGANMTTLNFQLAHAVARTLRAGRRDRGHAARPRRQRVALAAGGGRPRPGGALGADPARGRDARPRRARGADRRAHAGGGVHAGVERGGLAQRPGPDRRRGQARWARSPGPTACTSPRTGACARASGGWTCCSARPTSSSGRTWAWRRSSRSWPRAAGRPGAPRGGAPARAPLRDRHAVDRGRGRHHGGDRLPALARRRLARRGLRR